MDTTTPSYETTSENTDAVLSENNSKENNDKITFDYQNQLNEKNGDNDVFSVGNVRDSDLLEGGNGDEDINVDTDLEKQLLNSETDGEKQGKSLKASVNVIESSEDDDIQEISNGNKRKQKQKKNSWNKKRIKLQWIHLQMIMMQADPMISIMLPMTLLEVTVSQNY